jgi:hypothetical protein
LISQLQNADKSSPNHKKSRKKWNMSNIRPFMGCILAILCTIIRKYVTIARHWRKTSHRGRGARPKFIWQPISNDDYSSSLLHFFKNIMIIDPDARLLRLFS